MSLQNGTFGGKSYANVNVVFGRVFGRPISSATNPAFIQRKLTTHFVLLGVGNQLSIEAALEVTYSLLASVTLHFLRVKYLVSSGVSSILSVCGFVAQGEVIH